MKKRSEAKKDVVADEKNDEPATPKGDEQAADAFDFDHANRPKAEPLRGDLDRVVSTIFVDDIHETWKALEAALHIGEKSSDHGTLIKALDRAETNARKAHRLYVTAKVSADEWEKANDVVFSALWAESNRALQAEKEQGIRSKQITDADVRAKCAMLYPDEWKSQEIKRARVKATVDSLAHLSDTWLSRCKTLQTMLGKSR